ncbi:Rhodanese domain protein [Burkholderiales bacterium]|nr:Rhodanese domain protein [Burkholderiales bacterium]
MKRYLDLLADARTRVRELAPWDLRERLAREKDLLLLDVREPQEFAALRIPGSCNVPRGILEAACEWDFEETDPVLVTGRDRPIVVICRSGYRSLLAADVMQQLGFARVVSLRAGLKGWNDFDQRLVDAAGEPVDADLAETLLASKVRVDQRRPRGS